MQFLCSGNWEMFSKHFAEGPRKFRGRFAEENVFVKAHPPFFVSRFLHHKGKKVVAETFYLRQPFQFEVYRKLLNSAVLMLTYGSMCRCRLLRKRFAEEIRGRVCGRVWRKSPRKNRGSRFLSSQGLDGVIAHHSAGFPWWCLLQ